MVNNHATAPDQPTTEQADLPLLGMHCAACAARIEKVLGRAPGVRTANVNFATTHALVRFDPHTTNPDRLREAIRKAGYDALLPSATRMIRR